MAHRGPGLALRIARVLAPVTTLGPGERVGLWVQGCRIACPGCASLDTWDESAGTMLPVGDVAALVTAEMTSSDLRALTITGGEPTDQGPALAAVVDLVRAAVASPVDVLLFTGRTLPAARRRAPQLVDRADCVIAGPYRSDLPGTGRLVASSNQTVAYASDGARDRYAAWSATPGPALQVATDDRDLYLVGLPGAGDLDEFRRRLAARGVTFAGGVSWQP